MELEHVVTRLAQHIERRFYGKYRGLVVDNEDPETLGRLKVTVPSVLGEEVVTGWAVPCLPYGGDANRGILFVPEVGAGVWVEFEEGDLEFPIWVGTYWGQPGGDSELPKPDDAEGEEEDAPVSPPTRKIIKTAKGHTLQFEDADDAEMVILKDAVHGHVIVLDADGVRVTDGANGNRVVLSADGVSVTDGAGESTLVMDGDGITVTDGVNGHTIVLDSGGVTIESAGDVNISGQNVNITAQAKLTAEGNPIHLNP
jgi:uncharacterized protein involved in type VI secretion and phage assembly